MKALGALALSGVALGSTQLAAAETTTPIQDLVIVEETVSPDLDASRVVAPYHAYQPYGGYGYQPYGGYGYQPYGGYGHRPYGGYGHRPYGGYGYQPYGGYGHRPYGGYGHRPYGGYGHRPYGGYGHRPYGGYGYRPGFQPFGWYQPWRSLSGVEAAPGRNIPTPAVSLPDDR
ncbi:hypothetical protein [Sorangium sp. So ce341]|uniref:hypothetical protein n=1 Tax=Sorangium sp. So ce341 TaxID=3133302 RepID=UPI003F621283